MYPADKTSFLPDKNHVEKYYNLIIEQRHHATFWYGVLLAYPTIAYFQRWLLKMKKVVGYSKAFTFSVFELGLAYTSWHKEKKQL